MGLRRSSHWDLKTKNDASRSHAGLIAGFDLPRLETGSADTVSAPTSIPARSPASAGNIERRPVMTFSPRRRLGAERPAPPRRLAEETWTICIWEATDTPLNNVLFRPPPTTFLSRGNDLEAAARFLHEENFATFGHRRTSYVIISVDFAQPLKPLPQLPHAHPLV